MFLLVFLTFLLIFICFYWIFHKGRISKNTLQIALTPQKILPLSIFSVWTHVMEDAFLKSLGLDAIIYHF